MKLFVTETSSECSSSNICIRITDKKNRRNSIEATTWTIIRFLDKVGELDRFDSPSFYSVVARLRGEGVLTLCAKRFSMAAKSCGKGKVSRGQSST